MQTRAHDLVKSPRWLFWLVGLLASFWLVVAHAQDFLPPERAFAMQARQVSPNVVAISYRIADGYYMYRDRLELPSVNERWQPPMPDLPPGVVKFDPTFGQDMTIYYGAFEFMLELPPWPTDKAGTPFVYNMISQGCADAGLCYPPMTSAIELQPQGDGFVLLRQQALVDFENPFGRSAVSGSVQTTGSSGFATLLKSTGQAPAQTSWGELLTTGSDTSIAKAFTSESRLKLLVLFFGLGLLLAFTPCVWPMIPILSALIIGQNTHVTRTRGLLLAASYVAGMSVIYTILGVLAGLTGAGLAAWLQTPWLLTLFALLLVVFALAMFDVISIQMPVLVQSRLNALALRLPGGRMTTSAGMGAISALIVGPCVAAPLAGALLYISQTGDVVLGGAALFTMAWGMGVPLLLVGASAGTLLPKAGAWMSGVKGFFGVLLLATAWWMVAPILGPKLSILGWAALALFTGVLLGAFEPIRSGLHAGQGTARFYALAAGKTVGLFMAMVAFVWLIGLASGSTSLLAPLEMLKGTTMGAASDQSKAAPAVKFQPVRSVAELDQILSQSTKPVMLDFYADWCVSCKEMEAFTFSSPDVARRMEEFTLLKADVTANNADDRALLRRFNLFGPPGIMFFEPGGRYRDDMRVIGFQNADKFATTLDQVLRSAMR